MGKIFMMFSILISFASFGQEQSDTTLVQVTTKDGNKYIGTITYKDSEHVKLQTEKLGELVFNRRGIISIKPIDEVKVKKETYWLQNPHSTRYLFSTSAYGLKRKESYYQNIWVFFNQFNFGVTDKFSVGVGLMPFFLFGGPSTPVWLTPKFSIPLSTDRVMVSVGALVGKFFGEEDVNFGQLYYNVTFGSRDKNVTLGMGYGYVNSQLVVTPTTTLSSLIRISKRSYLISENFLIDTGYEVLGLTSLGLRRMIGRAALDFAVFIPVTDGDDSIFQFIPVLGVGIPLNK